MSRGLGPIEGRILDHIDRILGGEGGHRCILLSSWQLAEELSPGRTYPTDSVRKSIVRAMHSFCRKFPEFAVTKATGNKPIFLWERDDWRSGAWVEASMKSRYPVPFKALKIQWGRRLHAPTFGTEHIGTPGHPNYHDVIGVVMRHRAQNKYTVRESIRVLRGLSAVH
jgi:hypothetical protein